MLIALRCSSITCWYWIIFWSTYAFRVLEGGPYLQHSYSRGLGSYIKIISSFPAIWAKAQSVSVASIFALIAANSDISLDEIISSKG
jgi:hypothetical protein